MLVTKKRYKALEAKLESLQRDEDMFMEKYRKLASEGKTYAQIALALDCDKQYLYAKARKYKLEVRKAWDNVGQYFTAMLEFHIQGWSYRDLGQKYGVSHVRIHKIFANNGYIDFKDDVKHNTTGAREFAESYRRALNLETDYEHDTSDK